MGTFPLPCLSMFHYQMVISCIQPASSKAFTADATLVERFPVTWETDQAEKRSLGQTPGMNETNRDNFFRPITSMMYAFYASSSLGTKLNLTFTSNLSSCIGIVGVQSSQTQLNLNLSLSLPPFLSPWPSQEKLKRAVNYSCKISSH